MSVLSLFESSESFLGTRTVGSSPKPEIFVQVRAILDRVRREEDAALRHFSQTFDGLETTRLRVPTAAIETAQSSLPTDTRAILLEAIANVRKFHQKQLPESWSEVQKDGSRLGMRFTAIERIGCYIPGGNAGYPSTVIMTVVPAQIAGVKRIALVAPPTGKGLVNPLVMAAASLLEIDEIYAVGGAHALAALAFGTASIPKVDKIVGPGNAFVNEAKRQLFGTVGIDALAGPTELVILADDSAPAEFVVRDLFAQAEHDTDTRVVLVTTSRELAAAVASQAEELLIRAPRREILEKSLHQHGAIVLVPDLGKGVILVNQIAPEHVQIMTEDPEAILAEVRNAGAICLGRFTPAVVGDYLAGPNHVLPTGRSARFASPLSVFDFMKFSSLLGYSSEKFSRDAAKIEKFAELEGLINHRNAVSCRHE